MSWKNKIIDKIKSGDDITDYTRLFGDEYFPIEFVKNWKQTTKNTCLEKYCEELNNLPCEFGADRALPIIDKYRNLTELEDLDAQNDIEFILNECVHLDVVKSKLISLHPENYGSLRRKENFKMQIKTLFNGIVIAYTNYLSDSMGLIIRYCETAKKVMDGNADNTDFREMYRECLINLQTIILKGSAEILCSFLKLKPRNSGEISEFVAYKLKLHQMIENTRLKIRNLRNKKISQRSRSLASIIEIVPLGRNKFSSSENLSTTSWDDQAETLLQELEKNLMNKSSFSSVYLQLEIFSKNIAEKN